MIIVYIVNGEIVTRYSGGHIKFVNPVVATEHFQFARYGYIEESLQFEFDDVVVSKALSKQEKIIQ